MLTKDIGIMVFKETQLYLDSYCMAGLNLLKLSKHQSKATK